MSWLTFFSDHNYPNYYILNPYKVNPCLFIFFGGGGGATALGNVFVYICYDFDFVLVSR